MFDPLSQSLLGPQATSPSFSKVICNSTDDLQDPGLKMPRCSAEEKGSRAVEACGLDTQDEVFDRSTGHPATDFHLLISSKPSAASRKMAEATGLTESRAWTHSDRSHLTESILSFTDKPGF